MKLVVFDQSGSKHEIEDRFANSVMEVIRYEGLSISAQCGGSLSCGTCHVYVEPAWYEKLRPASEEEKAILELSSNLRHTSRLSCQIPVEPGLDGLVVTLASGTEF